MNCNYLLQTNCVMTDMWISMQNGVLCLNSLNKNMHKDFRSYIICIYLQVISWRFLLNHWNLEHFWIEHNHVWFQNTFELYEWEYEYVRRILLTTAWKWSILWRHVPVFLSDHQKPPILAKHQDLCLQRKGQVGVPGRPNYESWKWGSCMKMHKRYTRV